MAVLQMEQVPVQMRDRLQETLQATLQEIRLLPQTEITVRVRLKCSKTGDNTMILPFVILVIAAAAVIIIVIIVRKKKR